MRISLEYNYYDKMKFFQISRRLGSQIKVSALLQVSVTPPHYEGISLPSRAASSWKMVFVAIHSSSLAPVCACHAAHARGICSLSKFCKSTTYWQGGIFYRKLGKQGIWPGMAKDAVFYGKSGAAPRCHISESKTLTAPRFSQS